MKTVIKYLIFFIVLFFTLNIIISHSLVSNYMWKPYYLALDAFMNIDTGLNNDMQYISIDTSNIENIDNKNKEILLSQFKKYNVDVFNDSFDSLKQKGMVKDGNTLDGVLLSIDKKYGIPFMYTTMEITKFRSGDGAIGGKANILYLFGKIILLKAQSTWIS